MSFFQYERVDVGGVISPQVSQTRQSVIRITGGTFDTRNCWEYYLPTEQKLLKHHVPRHGVAFGVVPLPTALEEV